MSRIPGLGSTVRPESCARPAIATHMIRIKQLPNALSCTIQSFGQDLTGGLVRRLLTYQSAVPRGRAVPPGPASESILSVQLRGCKTEGSRRVHFVVGPDASSACLVIRSS